MAQNQGFGTGEEGSKTNLIVNYLPQQMSEKDLYHLFITIGPIKTCRIPKDYKTSYSYGYGFVDFQKEEDASKAICNLDGFHLEGKTLKVSYARPTGDAIKNTNLYVTNLPRHFSEPDLDALFGRFGNIVQKKILFDKITGMPRGVAFVRFDKKEDADSAMQQMNGYVPDGAMEPIQVKIAEDHGKQRASYYAGIQCGLAARGAVNSGVGRGGFGGGAEGNFNPNNGRARRSEGDYQGGPFYHSGGGGRGRGNFQQNLGGGQRNDGDYQGENLFQNSGRGRGRGNFQQNRGRGQGRGRGRQNERFCPF